MDLHLHRVHFLVHSQCLLCLVIIIMNYVSVLLFCVICLTTCVEFSVIFVNVYCTGMLVVIARRTCPSMSKMFTYLLTYLLTLWRTDRPKVHIFTFAILC